MTALAACEEPVELPDVPEQLLVESQLVAGEAPQVRLRVVDALGVPSTDPSLPYTEASLIDEAGNVHLLYVAQASDSLVYLRNDDLIVTPGERYSLRLRSPSFQLVQSTTQVPQPTALTYPGSDTSEAEDTLPLDENVLNVSLSFTDADPEANFYHVLVHELEEGSEGGVLNAQIGSLEFLFVGLNAEGHRPEIGGLLFSDEDFEEQNLDATLSIMAQVLSEQGAGRLAIELRTVSPDYYAFHRQLAELEGSRPSGPRGGRFNTSTGNVEGGIGFFGAYSSAFFTIGYAR